MKTLVDANTFSLEPMQNGEASTSMMETYKIKIKSDGLLDKLKTRIHSLGRLPKQDHIRA
jgi:hypothetical protein